MEIKKIALVGAGAVGSYIIMNLQPGMKENFLVLAEGERKARLEKQGVRVNGQAYQLNVSDYQSAGKVDLILLATKYQALPEVANKIKPLVGDNTVVLPLLNGIDSEAIVSTAIGEEHVMPAFMYIVAAHKEGGVVIDPTCRASLNLGEKDGQESERGKAIAAVLQENGVNAVLRKDVLSAQWNKYAVNLANNLPQAVVGVGYGAYFDSQHGAYLHQRIISEIFAVAAAEGVILTSIPTQRKVSLPGARFSTLQDLDAKRPTETDMFLRPFLELARKHGIAVPYSDYTYHALKWLEEKNAGAFDY